jgi:hypothetical protein
VNSPRRRLINGGLAAQAIIVRPDDPFERKLVRPSGSDPLG